MELLIVTALFLAYLSYVQWLHTNQVRDLEVKLMAKDTNDYARIKNVDYPSKRVKPVEDESDNFQDLEETNVDDVLKGIK